MTKDTFIKIYTNVILKYVDELLELQKGYGLNCLKFRKNRYNKIYSFYEKERLYIRHYFMDFENKPMDRHKIGSVMIYAILKSKPFSVNRLIPNLPNKLLMANEYLSFYVALSIVESYIIDDMKERNENNIKMQLILPKTYHEKQSGESNGEVYIENVCKALYYVKNMNNFDIFAYADILFLLEKHHDLSSILEKMSKNYKKELNII